MPAEPIQLAQLIVIFAAAALFLLGVLLSVVQFRWRRNKVRLLAKQMNYLAICLTLAALIWHIAARSSGRVLPLSNNFETLAGLAALLAIFSMYMQRVHPIPGLDWFLIPIVVLLLILAATFGRFRPDAPYNGGWWLWSHLAGTFGGVAAFAVAAAVGCVYLLLSARLRHKMPLGSPNLGNLERLERVTQAAARIGFALLTIGMITGLFRVLEEGSNTALGPHWMRSPKVILATCVWVIYALALHTPITATASGRRSAVLSIVGFVLMYGTLVAVQMMPRTH